MSMPSSSIARMASGRTCVASLPALKASKRSPAGGARALRPSATALSCGCRETTPVASRLGWSGSSPHHPWEHSRGLPSPHEGAHNAARRVPRAAGERLDTLPRGKLVIVVDACDFQLDVYKTRFRESAAVLGLFQRTSHAADPRFYVAAKLGGNLALYHNVGDGEPSTRPQHAVRFTQHLAL